MKNIRKTIVLVVMIITFFLASVPVQALDYGDYLNSTVEFMQDMYYQDMNAEESLKTALRGMFGGLDDYSGFYDREETEVLNSTLQGSFSGIGASLENDPQGIRITKVYEGAPAQKSGLMEGDIITAVNGVPTVNKDATLVAAEIKGEAGSTVRLTIRRAGVSDKDYTITREIVQINPVTWRLEGKTAYIRIETFNANTSDNFSKAMEAVDAGKINKILLDLRGNPGGYVDEAVAVAQRILPRGVITTLDFKSERLNDQVYESYRESSPYVIAVLVDEGTASASEILAGAIQDSGIGFLVGQNTFGKGVVQQMFSVLTPEAYAKYHEDYGVGYVAEVEWLAYYGIRLKPEEILGTVKITTGHYLTRNGRMIQGAGLKPEAVSAVRTNPNGVDLSNIAAVVAPARPVALNTADNEVFKAEKILRASGYFTQNPDKIMDSQTQNALKKFQGERKLAASGVLDAVTCEALNRLLNELRIKYDAPYVKAAETLGWF